MKNIRDSIGDVLNESSPRVLHRKDPLVAFEVVDKISLIFSRPLIVSLHDQIDEHILEQMTARP